MGNKIASLESLRGVAALFVVFHHYLIALYPAIFLDEQVIHSGYEWVLSGTPLHFFVNGSFAVILFFVLSGFVLSYAYFKKGSDLIHSIVKRYFRLMPVAFASVMLAYFIFTLGWFFNDQAGQIAQSSYLSVLWPADRTYNLFTAAWEGLVGIFAVSPNGTSLNPVLWTIYNEMIGSIIVFSVLSLIGRDSRRKYIYPMLLVVFISTANFGFIAGMILADIYYNRKQVFEFIAGSRTFYKVTALLLAVYMGAFPAMRQLDTVDQTLKPLIFSANYSLVFNVMYVASAVLIMTVLLASRRMNKVLSLKPLTYLGSLSYSLYAVHFIVMGSLGMFTFVKLNQFLSYNKSALLAFVVYLIASIIIAIIFKKYVDGPSIRLSHYVEKTLAKAHAARKKQRIRDKSVV